MLEKRIATNGHIYAKLLSLKQWDKNPRDIYADKYLDLKIKIATLGLFRPLFVTDEGVMVGGNMRLPAVKDLNENILEWSDKGQTYIIDQRGKYDEVKITELAFAQDQNNLGKFKAMLDGEIQEKLFDSIEQAMIEYAISDNMQSGFYDQQKAAELFIAHQDSLNMKRLELHLAPPVKMDTFVSQHQPDKDGPKLPDKEKGKSKEVSIIIKFTPEQFSDVEPRLEGLKAKYQTENITDLFTHMIDAAELTVDDIDESVTLTPGHKSLEEQTQGGGV